MPSEKQTTPRSALDLAREATELARQASSTGHTAVALAAGVLAAQYLQLARLEGDNDRADREEREEMDHQQYLSTVSA
jgi:hypothetical protein